MTPSPVFIAGPDRSGTTLLYALLASHPGISMVRRTNMWRYFYQRYGDLADPANLDRCLEDMVTFKRMRHLNPDAARIRKEFLQGEPTYGRLFSLFHEHHAERVGKPRWGDKSLHTEHYASRVFAEFPDARIIHTVRDPRDRYASLSKRYGQNLDRVGGGSARWLYSVREALKNQELYPGKYRIIRFEDLLHDPEGTLREVCDFIGEEFAPEMLTMEGANDLDSEGNSSFEKLKPRQISTRPIGRYRTALRKAEIKFIQIALAGKMKRFGYDPEEIRFNFVEALAFYGLFFPIHVLRLLGGLVLEAVKVWRGEKIPRRHLEWSQNSLQEKKSDKAA